MTQPDRQVTELDDPTAAVRAIVTDIADSEVGLDQSFFDLGLDSIQLMDVCTRINERYGEVIDLFLLFENPTVNDCATIIRNHQKV
jgi:acyl carrier protein